MTFLPIVGRELRVAARRRSTGLLRLLCAAAAIAVGVFFMLTTPAGTPAYRISKGFFTLSASLAFGFCMVSGVFLTADCLSYEKREGTLGLLFLTDLNGFDVVLGKLAASSLQCFYALLAIFPMLALPLLAGGVTAGEFWRMSLALVTTMLLSLVTGIVVSSVFRETRQTMMISFAILTLLTGVLPVMSSLERILFGRPILDERWLVASPVGGLTGAFDGTFRSSVGWIYWASIGTSLGFCIAGLIGASIVLPRGWQENHKGDRDKPMSTIWRRFRYRVHRPVMQEWSLRWGNPFYWICSRHRTPELLAWVVVGVIDVVWFLFFGASWNGKVQSVQRSSFIICMFTAYAAHVLFKVMVAIEASRRFSEDRANGALELLVVTPLPTAMILRGQRAALRRQFLRPMFGILALNAGLVWLVGNAVGLSMNGRDRVIFDTLFVGGAALLWLDVHSLMWVGMRSGLCARRHVKAVWRTLLRVMAPAWLGIVAIIMIGMTGRGLREETVQTMFTLWIAISGCYSAMTGGIAKAGLFRNFRQLAAGDTARLRRMGVLGMPGHLALRPAGPVAIHE